MRLERRILLLIILSILVPALGVNYGRLVMETRTKLSVEEQRSLMFATYIVLSGPPQRGTLDANNIARFRQDQGLLTVELIERDGLIRSSGDLDRIGQSTEQLDAVRQALGGTPVSRLIVGPSLEDGDGRPITMLDYVLLRPYREQTAHELWMAVPNANGGDPVLVFHSRQSYQRATSALAMSYKLQWAMICLVAVSMSIALRLALARWVERPLAELGKVAGRIAAGDRGVRVPVGPDDAIGKLSQAFNAMNDALVAKEREAEQDSVVGLLNHRALHRALAREVVWSEAQEKPVSILMLDLDGFKSVNDTWGHQFGDRVLQEIGELLLRHTRRSDIVGRYGGDEFMLILPGTDRDGAYELLERLYGAIRAFSMPNLVTEDRLLGVSIGCAVYPVDGTSPGEMIACADARLYVMKEAGREARVLAGR